MNNKKFYPLGLALLPFINSDMFSVPESLSGLNKMIFSILIITVLLLYNIINIVAYFGALYIIKYTDLESKYPKLKVIINYYKNTSLVFLIIEITFVILTLLTVIGLCLYLLYFANT